MLHKGNLYVTALWDPNDAKPTQIPSLQHELKQATLTSQGAIHSQFPCYQWRPAPLKGTRAARRWMNTNRYRHTGVVSQWY